MSVSIHKIGKMLQRVLKIDIGYLVKGGSFLVFGQILASISGLLLTIALARFLDQSEYGFYSYLFSIAGILAAFTLSGIDIAVAQAVAKGFDSTVIQGFKTKLIWSIPIGLSAIGAGAYYLHHEQYTLGTSLVVMGLFTPIIYACSLYGSYFNGKKQFKKIAFDNAFKNIAISATMILVAFLTGEVVYIVTSFFVLSAIISAIRLFLLIRDIQKYESNVDTEALSYGKHLSAMDTFAALATHIDKIIVFQLLGATQLALYSIAFAPVKQMQGISKVIKSLILPKFSKRTATELKVSMPHKALMFFYASVAIIALYWIVAELLFAVIFPQYAEALRYSQILSLSLLFLPFTMHVQALTSLGKKQELYILNISKPFIRVGLLLLLVPHFGILGAIYSFLLFYVLHYMMVYYYFMRIT